MSQVQLYQGDCLEIMPTLPRNSVQLIFADLPYGVTCQPWDTPIDLPSLWACMEHACAMNAPCFFSATHPFAATLIASNMRAFRYDIVWQKSTPTGFLNAKRMPMRSHESILVFYKKLPTYNPQMTPTIKMQGSVARCAKSKTLSWGAFDKKQKPWKETGVRYPSSVQFFASEKKQNSLHPTQKPVALMEWLLKTFTNPGDTVLDPTAGSMTTAIAALRTGRRAICIEKDPAYFEAGKKRVEDEQKARGAA